MSNVSSESPGHRAGLFVFKTYFSGVCKMADFDWVKARAECSLRKVFLRLLSGVRSDVQARDLIAQDAGENVHFEASDNGDRVLVTRTEGAEVRRIEFAFSPAVITVEGDGVKFGATPGLNNAGDCTLMVEGDELELWQVRRTALEKLFFGRDRPIGKATARK